MDECFQVHTVGSLQPTQWTRRLWSLVHFMEVQTVTVTDAHMHAQVDVIKVSTSGAHFAHPTPFDTIIFSVVATWWERLWESVTNSLPRISLRLLICSHPYWKRVIIVKSLLRDPYIQLLIALGVLTVRVSCPRKIHDHSCNICSEHMTGSIS